MKPKIGFLVAHGTDTMAWGLSYLGYAVNDAAFNVALVGSQIPLEEEANGSDGYLNLESAVTALGSLVPPHVFVAINAGKSLFHENAWKIDKWDITAFDGKPLMQKQSNQVIYESGVTLRGKAVLDRLFVLRTGGTIEESVSAEGVLRPDPAKHAVTRFLESRFGDPGRADRCHVRAIESYQLMAKDSSDLTPADWAVVASRIVELAGREGYRASLKRPPSSRVDVLFATPFGNPETYARAAEALDGLVFVGYGGGNVHLDRDEHSPIALFERVRRGGGWVVLGSHPAGGVLDPLYENGRRIFDRNLALPAVDFSIARAQVKLAFLLGHREEIHRAVADGALGEEAFDPLFAALFLSGAEFPTPESRAYFEKQWGVRIPREDLLIDRPFDVALRVALEALRPAPVRTLSVAQAAGAPSSTRFAAILEPDEFVGENHRGEEVRAGARLREFLVEHFEWGVVSASLDPAGLADESLAEACRRAKILFFEGGRGSVLDATTFRPPSASLEALAEFYGKRLRGRGVSRLSPPAVYLGLSMHLVAAVLRDCIERIAREGEGLADTPDAGALREVLRENLDAELRDSAALLKRRGREADPAVTLAPFAAPASVPLPYVRCHDAIARAYSGLLDDFVHVERVDATLVHPDELSARGVLFLNWALQRIAAFRTAHPQAVPNQSPVWALPAGIEATSAARDAGGRFAAEVASFVLYWIDREGFLYRDFGFQFHPELMAFEASRGARSIRVPDARLRSEGERLLFTATMASFGAFLVGPTKAECV